MDDGILMVLVIFKNRLIKPFSVFYKLDSCSWYSYIQVVIKILAFVQHNMKQVTFIQRRNGIINIS